MQKFLIRAGAALLVLVIGFAGMKLLTKMKKPQQKHPRPPVVKSVKVAIVDKQIYYPVIKALGKVKSEHPINLAAEVAGTVMPSKFKFKSGTQFKKGEMLVKIDPRRADLQFKSQISTLLNALASVLPEIKADLPDQFEKWNSFFSKTSFDNLPELPDVSDSKEKMYMSRFNVYNLYFMAKTSKITLSKHFLKAPFNGTIVTSNIRPGSMIGMGTPLGTLVRTDKMEIEVPLSETDAEWIDKKSKVTFKISQTGKEYTGSVDRIASAMAGTNQTISAYITVSKSHSKELMDGMYADVMFTGKELKDAFPIPRKAVVGKDRIYLIKNGKLTLHQVGIPRFGMEQVYVTHGISTGDTISVESIQDAIEGMTVRTFLKNEDGTWEKTWKEKKKTEGKEGQGKRGQH